MVSFFPPSTAAPMLSHSKTILVTGTYHPSAPIHLALSHLEEAQNPYVIAISSSRSIFKESLAQYDDHWLAINLGHGRISSLLAEISISSVEQHEFVVLIAYSLPAIHRHLRISVCFSRCFRHVTVHSLCQLGPAKKQLCQFNHLLLFCMNCRRTFCLLPVICK